MHDNHAFRNAPRIDNCALPFQPNTRVNHFDPVARRRTFAIFSHPDEGKTTLTEKLLPFGGAIQLAGGARQA
jgi:hypothetical protein